MAKNLVARIPRRERNTPLHTPAPVKGLNTIDPITQTESGYALIAQNFVASPQGLALRKGYTTWATNFSTLGAGTASIETMMVYDSGDTSPSKLFAVGGGSIFDITTRGVAGAPIVSGLSSSYVQSTMQTHTANDKHYLFVVTGGDAPRMYDGTSWVTCTQTASPSAPGQFKTTDNNGNAVDFTKFCDVMLHQQRLWFILKDSTKAYYTDIGSVGGNLYLFDFGSLFPRGGTLRKLATWTIDTGGGSGTQALLVAISSSGDTAIYRGDNPSSATSWALTHVYQLGAPVGAKCTTMVNGDLLYLSTDGLYPMSKYLQSERVETTAALTYKISPTISDIVDTFGALKGFEVFVYPNSNLIILNVPQPGVGNNFQFVFHTISNGWTQFIGMSATDWVVYKGELLFSATDGNVYRALEGYTDKADMDGLNGVPVVGNCLSAFDHFESQIPYGITKQVKAVKPYLISSSTPPSVKVAVNSDFNLVSQLSTTGAATSNIGLWNTAIWDGANAAWGGSFTTFNEWAVVDCYPGEAMALALSISSSGDIIWTGTQWMMETSKRSW